MKWGASVTLQEGRQDNPVLLAEGVETGLSLAQAFSHHTVKASLSAGNLAKVVERLPSHQSVVLCVDNDGASKALSQTVEKIVAQSFEQGRSVFVSHPQVAKTDFNDLHQAKGISFVQKTVSRDMSQWNRHYRAYDNRFKSRDWNQQVEKLKQPLENKSSSISDELANQKEKQSGVLPSKAQSFGDVSMER